MSVWVDVITASVAVLALVLSGVSIYFQFFKKIYDVRASLLDIRLDATARGGSGGASVAADFSFVNLGDVPCSVVGMEAHIELPILPAEAQRADVSVPGTPYALGPVSYKARILEWTRVDDSDASPFVIKPGSMLQRQIRFDTRGLRVRTQERELDGLKEEITYPTTVKISVVGPTGQETVKTIDGIGTSMSAGSGRVEEVYLHTVPRRTVKLLPLDDHTVLYGGSDHHFRK